MKSFLEFNLLMESFKDAKRIWLSKDSTLDAQYVDRLITKFKQLKDANFLSGQEKDISYWIPKGFPAFVQFMLDTENKYDKHKEAKELHAAKSKDAIKVFENDHCYVYNIQSHEASCKYGAGTKWCITQTHGTYWNDYYNKQRLTFYFIISKEEPASNPYYKIAVTVYTEKYEGIKEIYDATDRLINEVEFEDICEQDEIPLDIFQPREVITFKKQMEAAETLEQKIELLNGRWNDAMGTTKYALQWNEDYSAAVISTWVDYQHFTEECGNDTAKFCVGLFTGEEQFYIEDTSYAEEVFNMLDKEKVLKYIEENYPEEYDEDDQNMYDFLNERDDEVIDDCRRAAMYGEEAGAEADAADDFQKAIKDITVVDSDGYESDFSVTHAGNYWDEPFKIVASYNTIVEMLNDDFYEEVENGISFKFSVDSPHYGWYGFDEQYAKESLRDTDTAGDLV